MLPFLTQKRTQSIIVGRKEKDSPMELPSEHPLSAIAEDLIHAVKSEDVEGVANALEAAFLMVDSEPHQEGPHEE